MDTLQKLKMDTMLRDLSACVVKKKWQHALKICEKVLKIAPNHESVLHTLILTELHLNKFVSALHACQQFKDRTNKDIPFEEAYALYCQGMWAETMQRLSLPSLSQKDFELKAQVHFRLDEYDKCVEIYSKLLESSVNTSKANEMYANAVGACGLWLLRDGVRVKPLIDQFIAQHEHYNASPSTNGYFETNFNLSFMYFALGDYVQCIKLIESAIALVADDSRSEKLMKLQLAYIYQCKGDHRCAKKIIRTIPDNGSASLANSILAINRRSLAFKAPPLGDEHWAQTTEDRSLHHQKLPLYVAKRCHEFLQSNFSPTKDDDRVAIVQLMYLVQLDKEKAKLHALDVLKLKECDVTTAIYALNVVHEDTVAFYQLATEVLESFVIRNAAHFPGLMVLVGQFLKKAYNEDTAHAKLALLIDNLLKQDHLSASLRVYLLLVKAEFTIAAGGNYETASKCLSEAVKHDPKNRDLFIKFVSTVAHCDLHAASEILAANPLISALEDSAKMLDANDVEKYEQDMKKQKIKRKTDVLKEVQLRKKSKMTVINKEKKKRRMLKLKTSLKSYRPDISPDPERWLPKWQRVNFKKSLHHRQKKLRTLRVQDISEKDSTILLHKPVEPAKVNRVVNKSKKRGGKR